MRSLLSPYDGVSVEIKHELSQGVAGAFHTGRGEAPDILLGHRYYDPTTGRFLTRDPIGDGRNWYTYCESNPVSYFDAEGLKRRPLTEDEKYQVGKAIDVVEGGGWPNSAARLRELLDSGRIQADPDLDPTVSGETNFPIRGSQYIDLNPEKIPSKDDRQYTLPSGDMNLYEDRLWLASVLVHELEHTKQGYFWVRFHPIAKETDAWRKQEDFVRDVLNKPSTQQDPRKRESWCRAFKDSQPLRTMGERS